MGIAIKHSWFMTLIHETDFNKKYSSSWESDIYRTDAEILHLLYTCRFFVMFKVSRLKFLSFAKQV